MDTRLAHVHTWIFDLDNTLYPAKTDLFAQIDQRMGAYICDLLQVDAVAARAVQKDYFLQHGTTLRGLMHHHGIDPTHFLDYVHDIDMSVIDHDARLVTAIARLPGRKLVFTNADSSYAARVLSRLGLGDAFEAIYDIHATQYRPKPERHAYEGLCAAYAIEPTKAAFFEDMARNLVPAKAMGMTTLWINNGSEAASYEADPAAIDIEIDDLSLWLDEMLNQGGQHE